MENDVSQDDITDVMEMAQKIESSIQRTVKGNEKNLAMSAIMSATINSIVSQCTTVSEIQLYKHMLINIFDGTIMNIKIKDQK